MIIPTLLLLSARVRTMDPAHALSPSTRLRTGSSKGRPLAQAVAVAGDRIIAVGSQEEVEALVAPGTRRIDCGGGTLIPGFHDAHLHFLAYAGSLLSVDCGPRAVRNIGDIQEALARRARELPLGSWVRATGYNEFSLEERRHPTRWELDAAAPHHPVRLNHRSGHACVLNSLALRLVNIHRDTAPPPGGLIELDVGSGEPTGVLYEMTQYVGRSVPPLAQGELTIGVRRATERLLALGITSVQEASADNGVAEWETLQRLRAQGFPMPRVRMMVGAAALPDFLERGMSFGSGDPFLRLGAVKLLLTEAAGALHPDPEVVKEEVFLAHEAGFPVALHAVEEGTIAVAAWAIQEAIRRAPCPDPRHRIEHCGVCTPALQDLLRAVGAVVVTQPAFLYYHGERYLEQIGADQQPWLYPIGSLVRSGVPVAASSDCPVVPPDPLVGLAAAVLRRAETGQALSPEQGVTPMQALAMYTTGAAYAAFEEGEKGSIAPGKLADLALLSDDPVLVPPEQLQDIRVLMTILGGQIVGKTDATTSPGTLPLSRDGS